MKKLTPSQKQQYPTDENLKNKPPSALQVARIELLLRLMLRKMQLSKRRGRSCIRDSSDPVYAAWRRNRIAAMKELNRLRQKNGLSYRKAAEQMNKINHWHVHFMVRHRSGLDPVASFVSYAKRYNASH